MKFYEVAPIHIRLARYMGELQHHTAHDAEYRQIIAGRVADLSEQLRANDNKPPPVSCREDE